MAFREVGVHEIREVLRLWVRGEGLRSMERLSGLDRKTVRRYVAAAQSCGAQRVGGEGQLGDELLSAVAEAVRPHRADGHGRAWSLLDAHRDELFPGGLLVPLAPSLAADHPQARCITALARDAIAREPCRESRPWPGSSRVERPPGPPAAHQVLSRPKRPIGLAADRVRGSGPG